ncbi:hypothetical protein EFR00_31860 [Rhizobium sophoriradicis]|nr:MULTISPECIES: hypothetical protein [Rhizobium]RSB81222.1 hypothetical protein EFR00_31860 [Rhizobium sophoriradicis]
MVPPAQSRTCFGRHRARGYRPAQGDFSAVTRKRFASAAIRTSAIAPLLGGVGPMTIMSLRHNALISASMRRGLGVLQLR